MTYESKQKKIYHHLRDGNLDWLFFLKVYIKELQPKKTSRSFTYLKLVVKFFRAFLARKSNLTNLNGGLFFIDNSRHLAQANVLVPYVKNAYYHSELKQDIEKRSTRIDIYTGMRRSYLFLFKYLGYFVREEYKKGSVIFKNDLALAIHGILHYEHFLNFFKRNNIRYVVIFTDHSYKNRAFLFAAREAGVKTVFIPHASTTLKFPPLEFDYAFLEGNDMVSKYKAISKKWEMLLKTKIELVGNLKLNAYRNLSLNDHKIERKKIGLAFNVLDSLSKIKIFMNELNNSKEFMDHQIVFRPHPGLINKINLEDYKAEISNPLSEDSLNFLNRIDFLLTGDSNIALEAVLLKVQVFMIDIGMQPFQDSYGFVNNRICQFIPSIESLIKNRQPGEMKNWKLKTTEVQNYDYSFAKDMNVAKVVVEKLNAI